MNRSTSLALPIVACDASPWRGFLLPVVNPATQRLVAVPGEGPQDIVRRLPEGFAGASAFHVKTIGRSDRQRLVLFSVDATGHIEGNNPDDLRSAVDAVLRFSATAGLDFGCLDLMRNDPGQFHIVDMNATGCCAPETEDRIIEYLAPGGAAPRAVLVGGA